MRNADQHNHWENILKQVRELTLIEELVDMRELIEVNKYDLQSVFYDQNDSAVQYFTSGLENILLEIIEIERLKNSSQSDKDKTFEWKRKGIVFRLETFLNSDYFRTLEEKALHDSQRAVSTNLYMFDLYHSVNMGWDYLNNYDKMVIALQAMQYDVTRFLDLRNRIVNNPNDFLAINKEVVFNLQQVKQDIVLA